MPEISDKKIKEMLDEMRGTSSATKLKDGIEAMMKEDAEKAKAKEVKDKKLLEKIKAAEDKLKKEVEIEKDESGAKSKSDKDRDDKGKFTKTKPDDPEENKDKDEETIKRLTEQMKKMAKEVDALKKRKNYRTDPPEADKVDEVDDFIKQNITKDFEVVI